MSEVIWKTGLCTSRSDQVKAFIELYKGVWYVNETDVDLRILMEKSQNGYVFKPSVFSSQFLREAQIWAEENLKLNEEEVLDEKV